MLNNLADFMDRYQMVRPGDTVICALSGGADSVALLWGLYLLRQKLQIDLRAAHFNHGLRGEESDADAAFVRDLCDRYEIPLYLECGQVQPGKKGLEAAARDARYSFFRTLPGKIATAHTADDNAETVLMHLVRGTGLKGLGAIAPINGNIIRPMLEITRQEVISFLEEYHLSYVEDSSNATDAFLRNRLRHHVMPLLKQENPRLAENLSAMALRLREDEDALSSEISPQDISCVTALRAMHPAKRRRALSRLLENSGVREPEAEHITLAESLVFSSKPSARASFPGGITLCRNYDRLEPAREDTRLEPVTLACPGITDIPQLGLRIRCREAETITNAPDCFTVCLQGKPVLRSRLPGDTIRLAGGTKTLKKLFIDRKIPASQRSALAVLADDGGVVAVQGFGVNRDRLCKSLPGMEISIEKLI